MSLEYCYFTGKVCHATPKDATAMFRSAHRRKRREKKKSRHIYRCPKCGFWHFGMPDHKRKRFTF